MTSSQFILIDQNLRNFGGHYWEYDTSIAKYFSGYDHKVSVFTHASASTSLICSFADFIPWFSLTSADIYRPALYRHINQRFSKLPRSLLAFMKAVYKGGKFLRRFLTFSKKMHTATPSLKTLPFGAECVAAIRRCHAGGNDSVFIQTVHTEELRSLSAALAGIAIEECPRLLVMLRREPEEASMTGLCEALAPLAYLQGKKLFFFADTWALADAYRDQFGLDVKTVPVICDVSLIRQRLTAPKGTAKTLVYLGDARTEKGFQLLPLLLEELAHSYPAFSELEFHFQSYVPPDLYEGEVEAAIRKLQKMSQVFLYDTALSQEAFIDLLMKGDIILLPYDAARYRRRSSGILMQATAAGKVAVVPASTWFAKSVPADAVQSFTPGNLASAVRQVLDRYGGLETAARECGKTFDFQTILGEFYQCLMS